MRAAFPKRRSFICNYQRLTYHLPTFSTHKRYSGNPFICTKENKTKYRKMVRKPRSHVEQNFNTVYRTGDIDCSGAHADVTC